MHRVWQAGWLGICLVGAAVVEPVLARRLPGGGRMDLVLLVVVAWAVSRGPEAGAVTGTVGGLLQDLLSGHALGLEAGPKALVGFLFGLWRDVVHLEGRGVPSLAAFGATLVAAFARWGVRALVGWPAEGWTVETVLLACFHAVLAPPAFWTLRRGMGIMRPAHAASR